MASIKDPKNNSIAVYDTKPPDASGGFFSFQAMISNGQSDSISKCVTECSDHILLILFLNGNLTPRLKITDHDLFKIDPPFLYKTGDDTH
jgi:hypothetical protein